MVDSKPTVSAKQRVMQILREQNIRMSVSGCGCCGSPLVRFEYEGESVVESEGPDHEVNDFCFDMFDESAKCNHVDGYRT